MSNHINDDRISHISEEKLTEIARRYFSEQWAIQYAKDAIYDSFMEAEKVVVSVWIPTSEQLPDEETPVFILMDGFPQIGELRLETLGPEESSKTFTFWDSHYEEGKTWNWYEVTHWMPIPSSPAKEPK